jgi:hypothetical protein
MTKDNKVGKFTGNYTQTGRKYIKKKLGQVQGMGKKLSICQKNLELYHLIIKELG